MDVQLWEGLDVVIVASPLARQLTQADLIQELTAGITEMRSRWAADLES